MIPGAGRLCGLCGGGGTTSTCRAHGGGSSWGAGAVVHHWIRCDRGRSRVGVIHHRLLRVHVSRWGHGCHRCHLRLHLHAWLSTGWDHLSRERSLHLLLKLSLGTVAPAGFDLTSADCKIFEDDYESGSHEMRCHADKGVAIS